MVKRIEVETFLSHLGEGISRPALILGDDFNKYIIKKEKIKTSEGTKLFNCMFLNEILSYQIACHLEVPVADAAIAHVDSQLIKNDPTITFVHQFKEGIHFASQELQNKEENLKDNYLEAMKMGKPYIVRSWNAYFNNIVNKDDISKIIAFDLLIANFDRFGNTGNLLISTDEHEERKVFAIDHGHAFFGPIWDTTKIQAFKTQQSANYIHQYMNEILKNNNLFANGFGEVFRNIETSIDLNELSNHSFMEIVYRIENIDEDLIDNWLQTVPDEWFADKEIQIAYYKRFVLKQKNLVRLLIQEMANRRAFSNYRGGDLEWQSAKQAGTQ